MTPKDRAREATWDIGAPDWTTADGELLESRVEQAITAAVAEDRASRECCKMEREACAKIADESEENRGLLKQPDGELAAKIIAHNIRARSNASTPSTEPVEES